MIEQLIIIGFLFLANSLFVIGFYAAFSHGNILYPVYEFYCKVTRKIIDLLTGGKMEVLNTNPEYPYDFWIQQTREDIDGFLKSEEYWPIVMGVFEDAIIDLYPKDPTAFVRIATQEECDEFKEAPDKTPSSIMKILKPFQRLESIRAYLSKPLFLCSYCMPSLYAPLFFLLLNLTFPNALPFELSLPFFIIWIPCLCGFNYLLGYSIPLKSE